MGNMHICCGCCKEMGRHESRIQISVEKEICLKCAREHGYSEEFIARNKDLRAYFPRKKDCDC